MIQFPSDKYWLKARAEADNALFYAQIKFTRADLRIRLGKEPTENQILGWLAKNPLLMDGIRREILAYQASKPSRPAKKPSKRRSTLAAGPGLSDRPFYA